MSWPESPIAKDVRDEGGVVTVDVLHEGHMSSPESPVAKDVRNEGGVVAVDVLHEGFQEAVQVTLNNQS